MTFCPLVISAMPGNSSAAMPLILVFDVLDLISRVAFSLTVN